MTYEQQIINDITVTLEALQVQPILFIGSGMSQRYFDAPNWKGLMELLAEKCPKIPKKFPKNSPIMNNSFKLKMG